MSSLEAYLHTQSLCLNFEIHNDKITGNKWLTFFHTFYLYTEKLSDKSVKFDLWKGQFSFTNFFCTPYAKPNFYFQLT